MVGLIHSFEFVNDFDSYKMSICNTILPIFIVVLLGWILMRIGFLQEDLLGPANKLVFYVAIPAMVFNALAKASFKANFDGGILLITVISALIGYAISWMFALLHRLENWQIGSYVQSAFHGNLGYVGLAVSFYYLGEPGFVKASILAGFMFLFQNLLSVFALTYNDQNRNICNAKSLIQNILLNPVIISAMGGIGFSLSGVTLPIILVRSLEIISDFALPLALLIIGASINLSKVKKYFKWGTTASLIKLVIIPAIGFMGFLFAGFTADQFLPALILLATPSATTSYVMSKEMNGDPNLAVIIISMTTLLSAITISIWLMSSHDLQTVAKGI